MVRFSINNPDFIEDFSALLSGHAQTFKDVTQVQEKVLSCLEQGTSANLSVHLTDLQTVQRKLAEERLLLQPWMESWMELPVELRTKARAPNIYAIFDEIDLWAGSMASVSDRLGKLLSPSPGERKPEPPSPLSQLHSCVKNHVDIYQHELTTTGLEASWTRPLLSNSTEANTPLDKQGKELLVKDFRELTSIGDREVKTQDPLANSPTKNPLESDLLPEIRIHLYR